MRRRTRSRLVGIAYLAPALIFVLAFTAYPLGQMVWMSFHNWSLITPPRYVGLANYRRALDDTQFWVSFLFTLEYTALITPVRPPSTNTKKKPKMYSIGRSQRGRVVPSVASHANICTAVGTAFMSEVR